MLKASDFQNHWESDAFLWCGQQDLNLHGCPREPKSRVSANSTMPADIKKPIAMAIGFFMERPTRLELATSTLARWRSTR